MVKYRIYSLWIMKGALADYKRCGLLDAVVGTVKKLIQCADFQGIFDLLRDVLRLIFRGRYSSRVAVVYKHLAHQPNDCACCKSQSEEEEPVFARRREGRHFGQYYMDSSEILLSTGR